MLDANATLFLNLHALPTKNLFLNADGTMRYDSGDGRLNVTPCVLHTNSADKSFYAQLARLRHAWVVDGRFTADGPERGRKNATAAGR